MDADFAAFVKAVRTMRTLAVRWKADRRLPSDQYHEMKQAEQTVDRMLAELDRTGKRRVETDDANCGSLFPTTIPPKQ